MYICVLGHNPVTLTLTGHDENEWAKLFDSIAKIPGVIDMEKCVLLPDEEPALTTAFNRSKIPKEMTVATCHIHTEWKVGAQKMSDGRQFGRR